MKTSVDLDPIRPVIQAVPWPAVRTRALRGQCRAGVLGNWATNLDRRLGPGSADAIVAELAIEGLHVDRMADAGSWVPVALQLRLTERIVDRALGGDRLAMLRAVVDDVVAGTSRAGALALRTLGPRALFERFGAIHALAYDVGKVEASTGRGTVLLRFGGTELFEHPTWQLLQLAAVYSVFELTGRAGHIERLECGRGALSIAVRW